jgi:hypothetical protein
MYVLVLDARTIYKKSSLNIWHLHNSPYNFPTARSYELSPIKCIMYDHAHFNAYFEHVNNYTSMTQP